MDKNLIIAQTFINGKFSPMRARSEANRTLREALEREHGQFSTNAELVYVALHGASEKTCECGKLTPFLSFTKGYREFCSATCMSSSKKVKEKRVASNEATCMKRYGVTNPLGVKEIREKATATMVSRYGVDNFAKSPMHRELVRETSQAKYGVDHPLSSPDLRDRIMRTMQNEYGGFTTQSPLLNSKMRDTMITKYGARSSWESSTLLPKLHAIQLSKFIKRVSENYIICEIGDNTLKVTHECGHQFKLGFFEKIKCPGCSGQSLPGKELFLFVNSLIDNTTRNNRKILNGKELDVLCTDQNIAFEMNGVYWHHDRSGKLPLLEKTIMAKSQGIHLIHIWDYEWWEKSDIICAIIKSKLGQVDRKINARSCIIKEIDLKTSQDFLNLHHLQGSCRSSLKLGLFYENELVGVATFGKPRFEKFDGIELMRMCFAPGVQVRGGVSKLMSYVKESILTYADARFSDARGYLAAGFTYLKQTAPGYHWFKSSTGLVSRHLSTKSNLPKLLGSKFDSRLSEDVNMRNAGFLKLIDCGHHKLVLTRSKI